MAIFRENESINLNFVMVVPITLNFILPLCSFTSVFFHLCVVLTEGDVSAKKSNEFSKKCNILRKFEL